MGIQYKLLRRIMKKTMQCNECGLILEEIHFHKSEKDRNYKKCNPCHTILNDEAPWEEDE